MLALHGFWSPFLSEDFDRRVGVQVSAVTNSAAGTRALGCTCGMGGFAVVVRMLAIEGSAPERQLRETVYKVKINLVTAGNRSPRP